MPILVNVRGIRFDDLIPRLRQNEHIKDICDNIEEETRVLGFLHNLFDKLQNGESCEHYVIGSAMGSELVEMGLGMHIDIEEYKDDFMLIPVTDEMCQLVNKE